MPSPFEELETLISGLSARVSTLEAAQSGVDARLDVLESVSFDIQSSLAIQKQIDVKVADALHRVAAQAGEAPAIAADANAIDSLILQLP